MSRFCVGDGSYVAPSYTKLRIRNIHSSDSTPFGCRDLVDEDHRKNREADFETGLMRDITNTLATLVIYEFHVKHGWCFPLYLINMKRVYKYAVGIVNNKLTVRNLELLGIIVKQKEKPRTRAYNEAVRKATAEALSNLRLSVSKMAPMPFIGSRGDLINYVRLLAIDYCSQQTSLFTVKYFQDNQGFKDDIVPMEAALFSPKHRKYRYLENVKQVAIELTNWKYPWLMYKFKYRPGPEEEPVTAISVTVDILADKRAELIKQYKEDLKLAKE